MSSTNDVSLAPSPPPDARSWAQLLDKYRKPSNGRATFEIAVTIVPFVALWVAMWASLDVSYLLTLVLAVPAAGLLMRLFMIQHDCGHGAFFTNRLANDWTGRIMGVMTLTPYGFWRRTHAMHHASSGHLERRGSGDINTLTVAEYRELSSWGRLGYRIYRHPLVLFVIGPAYLFVLQYRLPVGMMRGGWQPWLSTMGTNLAITVAIAAVIWIVGAKAFFLVHAPITLIAASIGVWLFFVQHQFEHTTWAHEGEWQWPEAALHGSSHYDLPPVLRWFTANIGMHHVHHLCSRIPYYRLPQALRDHPSLVNLNRITPLESLQCRRLALWEETQHRMVSFKDARLAA